MLTQTQRDGLAVLGANSHHTFDPYRVAGDRNADLRQQIMALLTGQKVPRHKCGVNAMRAALHAIHKPEGDCLAAQERAFEAWARAALGLDPMPD